MALRVLIVQSEAEAAQTLADLFARRGDEVIQAEEAAEVLLLTRRHLPDLLVMDLHLPGEDWLEALRYVRENHPDTKIILTNKYPDFRRELLAKEQGLNVFLRQPFTSRWLARALRRLPSGGPKPPSGGPKPKETRITPAPRPAHPGEAPASPGHGLPAVRLPLRVKITFPYTLLAVAFAVAAAYLVSRYVLESIRDRFNGQLIDAGKLAADWMVQEENRLLTSLRLLANLQGMADAIEVVSDHDAAQLRTLALPIAVNYQEEAVEILNLQGQSVLSLRHVEGGRVDEYSATEGETAFVQWPFVTQVLAQRTDRKGDKYAGLARAGWGDYFYVVGPVFDLDGDLAGAILVGKSLRSLAREIRQDTLAQISLYELNGQLLTSTLSGGEVVLPLTLAQASEALDRQDGESWTRELKIASVNYSEIVGPWEARGGEDLGLVGVSLAPAGNFLRPTLVTNVQAFVIVLATFLAVVAIGVYVANRITRPLLQMVRASTEVARGNLEIKVDPSGDDEVAVLAHAFNYMVSGLQEGSIYRDLLGRTVSPEVREELRESFASGNLRLEGQTAIATVLMSDIRGFTTLSEHEAPTTVLTWLNEYFGELVPIITARGGVLDKFQGDAMLAVFGVLPRPLPPEESAYQACLAAIELLHEIERINARRQSRGEPLFITGIGINTGPVIAGGLGTSDRLNYTIIGDTVNTTQRLEGFTREFGESGAVISQPALDALHERRAHFRLSDLGTHTFKGKTATLSIYRLWPTPEAVRIASVQADGQRAGA